MLKVLRGSIGTNKEPLFFLNKALHINANEIMLCSDNSLKYPTRPNVKYCSVLNANVDVTDCQFFLYSCESVRISTNTGVLFSQELCHCTINHRLLLPVWSEHHVLCTRNGVCAMHRSRTFPLFQWSSHYPLPNGQPASPQVLQNLLYNTCDERCVY